MRQRVRVALRAVVVALLLVLAAPSVVLAQDVPSTGVPTQDIVPQPNTGHEPAEAGDRGGALQLLLPVLIVAAVGGAIWHLTRQSRRARSASDAR